MSLDLLFRLSNFLLLSLVLVLVTPASALKCYSGTATPNLQTKTLDNNLIQRDVTCPDQISAYCQRIYYRSSANVYQIIAACKDRCEAGFQQPQPNVWSLSYCCQTDNCNPVEYNDIDWNNPNSTTPAGTNPTSPTTTSSSSSTGSATTLAPSGSGSSSGKNGANTVSTSIMWMMLIAFVIMMLNY